MCENYETKLDLRKFFPTITKNEVEEALRKEHPDISQELLDKIILSYSDGSIFLEMKAFPEEWTSIDMTIELYDRLKSVVSENSMILQDSFIMQRMEKVV